MPENYRGIKLTSHTLKIWERVLNDRIKSAVEITSNQCGFVSGYSTSDAIQTVKIMVEKYRCKKKNLHMVFIDLEKAFDRVPRELVWKALRSHNVPEEYVLLIQDMYTNCTTQIRTPCGITNAFPVRVGVHQGSAISPLLFNIVMDHLTSDIQDPLPWNILYADDIVLISENLQDLQTKLNIWNNVLEANGLRISAKKTEYLFLPFEEISNIGPQDTLRMKGDHITPTAKFKYLGSYIDQNGTIDEDVKHRVNAAWMKWKNLTGVLCDKKISCRLKGKVYKTAVRPVMMYGSECWAAQTKHIQKIHAAEMKMLRWTCGVTRMDKIKNVHIRGSLKVAPIAEKLKENRLRWYGHVMRRNEEHIVHKALNIEEPPRTRGRPRATWLGTVKKDIRDSNLENVTTQDRN